MCLAALAAGRSERFPWVLASNRDEFFAREAEALAWWPHEPGTPRILGGRDLSAGGTWLALTEAGRLALVTNVREPGRFVADAPSRGDLVPRWLLGDPDAALREMAAVPRNGFNFLAADLRSGQGLWFSNRPQLQQCALTSGLHGLSNAALDTPWPKLQQLKQRLARALQAESDIENLADVAFTALADPRPAPDADLPATGVPLERERQLSPAFIRINGENGVYGTRCSTLVIVERTPADALRVHVRERRFGADAAVSGETAIAFELA